MRTPRVLGDLPVPRRARNLARRRSQPRRRHGDALAPVGAPTTARRGRGNRRPSPGIPFPITGRETTRTDTASIQRIPADNPAVFAFRICGRVDRQDFEEMGKVMNAAFDAFDRVNMLLVFDGFEGREIGASWDPEAMKAQFRSLGKVEKYVVVGAPSGAETMLQTFGSLIPVETTTFPRASAARAWAEGGARPIGG